MDSNKVDDPIDNQKVTPDAGKSKNMHRQITYFS